MKKFLTGILALLMVASLSMAQTPAAKPAKKEKAKTEHKADSTAKPMKKDGTPDKRFKANKETAGPKKKDGTPDKRYKANQ